MARTEHRRSEHTELRPQTYGRFPKPICVAQAPTIDTIEARIDNLRMSTREEMDKALGDIKLRGRERDILEKFIPENNPTGEIDQMPPRHRKEVSDQIAKYHLMLVENLRKNLQIDSDTVDLAKGVSIALQTAHDEAESWPQLFTEDEQTILEELINQFWGVELEKIAEQTGLGLDQIPNLIRSINEKARDGLTLRIHVRNGIAIITSRNEKTSVPCLNKKRRAPKNRPKHQNGI